MAPIYKCPHCDFTDKFKSRVKRHQNKKNKCGGLHVLPENSSDDEDQVFVEHIWYLRELLDDNGISYDKINGEN